MRTYVENDQDDVKEAAKINAEPWMLDCLKRNPEYVCWGPHEDYMTTDGQWSGPVFKDSWEDFGPWGLNELNELVNFYFEVSRPSKECPECGGSGYHKSALRIVNGFYSHMNDEGEEWVHSITQDEADALAAAGRLQDFSRHGNPATAEAVNAWSRGRKGIGHDAINRSILTRTRIERHGLPVYCDKCGGDGYVFTDDKAVLNLVLWFIHPRKGSCRGVEIKNIAASNLPDVFGYLKQAASRNADRFSKI